MAQVSSLPAATKRHGACRFKPRNTVHAIALRYGNLYGPREEQTVIVIDGGFADSGEALVKHVRDYYGTDR